MKPTAFIINASRGPVIDEAALIQALKENWIAGAGLDVLEIEPPRPDNPLFAMENVILTCHAAGTTVESTQDWLDEWKKIIEVFLSGSWPINVVNPTVKPRILLRTRVL
jgi:phosphoglycerate dehydrogenase-like enzyme